MCVCRQWDTILLCACLFVLTCLGPDPHNEIIWAQDSWGRWRVCLWSIYTTHTNITVYKHKLNILSCYLICCHHKKWTDLDNQLPILTAAVLSTACYEQTLDNDKAVLNFPHKSVPSVRDGQTDRRTHTHTHEHAWVRRLGEQSSLCDPEIS